METQQRIAVGAEVSWQSQAAGSYVKKTGVIEAFVPQKADVRAIWRFLHPDQLFGYSAKFQAISAFPRYLVKVQRKGKNGKALKAQYYCPAAWVVEKQNLDAPRGGL